jgi:hypothetical protein
VGAVGDICIQRLGGRRGGKYSTRLRAKRLFK